MSDNTPHVFTDHYEIDVEFRGETLHYIEGNQRTAMTWTWVSQYTVYSDTVDAWTNADGSRTPITDEEKRIVLERVVKHATDVQHVKMNVE